jgi:hypothetical protein
MRTPTLSSCTCRLNQPAPPSYAPTCAFHPARGVHGVTKYAEPATIRQRNPVGDAQVVQGRSMGRVGSFDIMVPAHYNF